MPGGWAAAWPGRIPRTWEMAFKTCDVRTGNLVFHQRSAAGFTHETKNLNPQMTQIDADEDHQM